jgi:hypothetical protein
MRIATAPYPGQIMRARFVSYFLALLAGLIFGQSGAASSDRNFQSWRADCSNTACSIQSQATGDRVYLHIARASEPSAPWHVSLTGLRGKIGSESSLAFWVNGAPISRLAPKTGYRRVGRAHFIADETALVQLFPGLAKGNRLAVSFIHWRGGRRTVTFSLSGLAPLLRWIDEQQNRSNRQHYVAAPGGAGHKVIPIAMTQPILAQTVAAPIVTTQSTAPATFAPQAVKAPASTSTAPGAPIATAQAVMARSDASPTATQPSPPPQPAETFGLPGPVFQALQADKRCDLDRNNQTEFRDSIVKDQLDANRTLFLLACSSGAYNTVFRIYIYDRRYPDEAAPELFVAYSSSRGWYGKRSLIHADYDPKTRTISAFEKGRSLGDCGSLESYKWTADGLRLVSFRYWGRCNGSRMPKDWPEIYSYGQNKKPKRRR